MSDSKIGEQHRTRKAMLYVRQSSLHQVEHHHESRRLQYAMKERLESLGWQEVEVVDDDLGRARTIKGSCNDKIGRLPFLHRDFGRFKTLLRDRHLDRVHRFVRRPCARAAKDSNCAKQQS